MSTVRTYLQRTIIYVSPTKCLVCGESDRLIRKDYCIDATDPMHVVYGPGNDNYGRDRFSSPPPPIPDPDSIQTQISCEGCLVKWTPEKIKGLRVVSDSAQEEYDKHKEKLRKWLDTDSTDSE